MLSGQSEITSSKSQIQSFSQFHPLSTKLSPRNQEETRIAAQERKAFDFEVGDGWKDLSPCFIATTLVKQNPFLHSQTVIALLCSPCGFVSPKQLVVQSQCRLAREEVCMDACIVFSMNLMIVHLYKSQQVYSTSIHLLLPWNSGSKTEQNMQENQFLKHRPDVGKGICWSLRAISSFM